MNYFDEREEKCFDILKKHKFNYADENGWASCHLVYTDNSIVFYDYDMQDCVKIHLDEKMDFPTEAYIDYYTHHYETLLDFLEDFGYNI